MAIRKVVEVEGLENVLKNLNKEIEGIKNRTRVGMIKSAILVRGDAQRLCPMDTGNLVNSAYTVVTGGTIERRQPNFKGENKSGKVIDVSRLQSEHEAAINLGKSETDDKDNPSAVIGFSAYYAPYVHEMTQAIFKRPGSQAKFLETSLKENSCRILEILRKEASVKK